MLRRTLARWAPAAAAAPRAKTPMMRQYARLKAENPDAILAYRSGDFYEFLEDDAKLASEVLGIALTRRGRTGGSSIPMCGFPHHALEGYLQRLVVRSGLRVAVCEQIKSTSTAGQILDREVVRVVTPGTVTEDQFLEPSSASYVAAVAVRGADDVGLAWIDVSTGETFVTSTTASGLATELALIRPREVVVESGEVLPEGVGGEFTVTVRPPLEAQQGDAEDDAWRAVLAYVESTQRAGRPRLHDPVRRDAGGRLEMLPSTRKALELSQALAGTREGSLLHAVDRTSSAAGSRLLQTRLASPLTDCEEIDRRLSAVEFFLSAEREADADLSRRTRRLLGECGDIQRCLQRLVLGTGGPRDLQTLARTLESCNRLSQLLRDTDPPERVHQWQQALDTGAAGRALIARVLDVLVESPPAAARALGFVREGVDPQLDEWRSLARLAPTGAARTIPLTEGPVLDMQRRWRAESGLETLKVASAPSVGLHLQVPSAVGAALLDDERCHLHSKTKTVWRFTTAGLLELQERITHAKHKAEAIEMRLFEELRDDVLRVADVVDDAARALADLDVSLGLARLAEEQGFVRPRLSQSMRLAVRDGRHTVVEQAQAAVGRAFVSNDLDLCSGGESLWLLTGPNMGGKSTFLRQNAHIAILAQMGSFVPAGSADVGVVDRVFSRIGASDDLANDQSTFMLEMTETAAILQAATPRSLVLMDEIGRGTSPEEGVAIARAVLEALAERGCRTLFATHFHELGRAPSAGGAVAAKQMLVLLDAESLATFTHKVVPGVAADSHAITVARMAGVPEPVLARAQALLG